MTRFRQSLYPYRFPVFRGRKAQPEYDEQVKFVEYVRAKYPDLLFTASTQGLKLTAMQGARFKKMGYLAGTPDLLFFQPTDEYHGLFVEMKSERGIQSPEQRTFQGYAERSGYKYSLCRSAEKAIEALESYLQKENTK